MSPKKAATHTQPVEREQQFRDRSGLGSALPTKGHSLNGSLVLACWHDLTGIWHMKPTTCLLRVGCLLLFLTSAGLNAADSQPTTEGADVHPWLTDPFLVSVGAFFPQKNIKISARGELEGGGQGEVIDFDETFKGGESEDIFAANFHWRFGEKWWLAAEYYASDFRESAELAEDKEWNGVLFPAGSFVKGGADFELTRAILGREIHSGPRDELSIGLGIHWVDISAFLEGEALVGNETTGIRKEKVTAAGPVPNLSAWYVNSFRPKWLLQARVDWLSVSIQEYSGGISHTHFGVNYQLGRHVGVSLAYKMFQVDVDVKKRGWYGSAEYTQRGPFLAVTGNW